MAKNNPNKANQYRPDPRQSLFLQYYLDPESETFSNSYRSALKAGYEEEYARVITTNSKGLSWLSESVNDNYLIKKAEQNLKEFLEDSSDRRIQADITKFVSERLNKKKYSTRNELTGADGEKLEQLVVVKDASN